MKILLRLYPRSWRARYGGEMEDIVDRLPAQPALAVDLLHGAARAYVDVIRANRLLSTAGAFLHGLTVAVLLQAIAFVSIVFVAQGSREATDVHVGPFHFVMVYPAQNGTPLRQISSLVLGLHAPFDWVPAAGALMALLVALAIVIATPRLLRAAR
jgi:TctA family transporter